MENNKTVLVAEDEVILRMHFCKALNRNGIQTVCATNGRKALDLLKQNKVDLIISDINMPDMDGYEFLERIRENPVTSGIPFIFVTARATSEDKLTGLKLGVRDYITKPVNTEEMVLRVKNVLETTSRSNGCLQSSSSLAGMIKPGTLMDIIQFICQSKQAGSLKIEWQAGSGAIWSRDGEIQSAFTSDGSEGENAVQKLLQVSEGHFYFLDSNDPPQPNIDADIMQILLKGSVTLDAQLNESLKIAVIRYKALCRKMSEFHLDSSPGTFDPKDVSSIETHISEIDFSKVRDLTELLVVNNRLDDLEVALGALFSRSGDKALDLFSREEELNIETATIRLFMKKPDFPESLRKQVQNRLDSLDPQPRHSEANSDPEQIVADIYNPEKTTTPREINFTHLQSVFSQLPAIVKSKEPCRLVHLSKLKKYFHQLTAISDDSPDIRIGFIGLYNHLISLFKSFSNVPQTITKLKDNPEDPVLLMTRLTDDDGNYIYLIGLPMLAEEQETHGFINEIDMGVLVHKMVDSEKAFNREILLRLISELPENRIILMKNTGQEKVSIPVFERFKNWENQRTVSSHTFGKQSFMNVMKFCSERG